MIWAACSNKRSTEIAVTNNYRKNQIVSAIHDCYRIKSSSAAQFAFITTTTTIPWFSTNKRQQTITRMVAGQNAQIVANAFKVNVEDDRLRTTQIYHASPRSTARGTCWGWFTRVTETARQTIGTHQRFISTDTARRRLVANNIRCRRPARGPVLTFRHWQEPLQWITEGYHWRHRQRRNILFTDDSRFCI